MRRMSMGIIAMRTTAMSMWTGPRQRHGRVDGLPLRFTCHAHACTWLAIVHGRAMFCHGRAMGLPAHGMVRHFIDMAFGMYMAMPRCAIVREYIAIGACVPTHWACILAQWVAMGTLCHATLLRHVCIVSDITLTWRRHDIAMYCHTMKLHYQCSYHGMAIY